MTPMLVALHGQPRHGKDTLADALVAWQGYRKFAFADPVYAAVAAMFCVTQEIIRSDDWKKNPQEMLCGLQCEHPGYRAWLKENGHDLWEARTSRFHLRMFGTEYTHSTDPMKWINETRDKMMQFPHADIVISDVRFPRTEYEFLRRYAAGTGRGFTLIEVMKEGEERVPASGHVSDIPFPSQLVDLQVINPYGHPERMLQTAWDHIKAERTKHDTPQPRRR
jgi:hypothetical protein